MIAIAINDETTEKIVKERIDRRVDELYLRMYSAFNSSKYVFVRDYVNPRLEIVPYTVLPLFAVVENFDYDESTIDTEWTDIYRKVPDSLW